MSRYAVHLSLVEGAKTPEIGIAALACNGDARGSLNTDIGHLTPVTPQRARFPLDADC